MCRESTEGDVQVQTRDLCAPAVPTVGHRSLRCALSGHLMMSALAELSEDATLALSMKKCVGPKRESL